MHFAECCRQAQSCRQGLEAAQIGDRDLNALAQAFVAHRQLSVRLGLTSGEIARLLKSEFGLTLDLQVIPCEGWTRDQLYDATGLMWVNPSPNMRSLAQAFLYPGVGLLETTHLSMGRGTDAPFEFIGAPWIEARRLAAALNR